MTPVREATKETILTGKRSACADASTSPRSGVGWGGGRVVLNSPIWPIQGCAGG